MIEVKDIMRQLSANAEAMRTLMQSVSDAQAEWKPTPDSWCLKEVVEHLYNEERIDFRMHIKEMFHNPPFAWGALNGEGYIGTKTLHEGLAGFLAEREVSLALLEANGSVDVTWDTTITAVFGPDAEKLVLKAGDILVSWVAHDYLHLRQINELLFAWNEHQAKPYSVQYAGRW